MSVKPSVSAVRHIPVLRGELALLLAILINSFGVVLMLYSGSGISAISSVPYAFSKVFPNISLGTFTYLFQGLLVLSLMILRKKFVPSYLFSFAAGFCFSELLDVHLSAEELSIQERKVIEAYRANPDLQHAVNILLGIEEEEP